MKVWIDQDLCTGAGVCEDIAPGVIAMGDDGLAYVVEGGVLLREPGGDGSMAVVPAGQEEAVIEAAEQCPAECIYLEL
jgi:ferredoxin